MTTPAVGVDVSGGQIQGIVGAGSVVIENLTFYSCPPEEPVEAKGAEPIGPCPYPGLAFFGPGDADLFFGRDAAIARLTEAVGARSFTALMGASGSGKSSVVLAGLTPRLNSTGNWRFSHFRIGTELDANPFLALSRALTPLYVESTSDVERLKNTKLLATSLAAGELTLRDVFADCRSRNKGRRILLIADQFEEVFTTVADDEVRTRFIDVLLAGFPDPTGVPDICLVLTMRADFYGRALHYRPLADALQGHVENLGPMNREELQTAVVRPAQNAGVTFEAGVVETLLDTVQSKPGGLPLLQFALREMWGRQERKKITRKSYDEIGGVEGALAQRAETVFARLTRNGADPAMDKAFQRLFTRLVTLGEGQEDTRRVVERAELGDEVWGLAQRLAGEENRLVVTNASSARETAEVVHEALIRHWPKLVDWINRDRAFQSWLRQIGSGLETWSANPEDEGPLLRGGMLAQASEWLARRRDDLSDKERAYIEASIALRQREEAAKEAARQAEIEHQKERAEAAQKLAAEQQQGAKTARRYTAVAAAIALVAVGAAFFAVRENRRAESALEQAEAASIAANQQREDALNQRAYADLQRTRAEALAEEAKQQHQLAVARQLATEARVTLTGDASGEEVQRSLSLATESLRFAWTQEGFGAWSEALKLAPLRPKVILDRSQGPFASSALSPDGSLIAAAGKEEVVLIDAKTFKALYTLAQPGGTALAFSSPKGDLLAVGTGRKVHIWNTAERKLLSSIPAQDERFEVKSIAFDPAGKRLAYAGMNYYGRLFETSGWTEVGKKWSDAAQRRHEPIIAVRFSPDGNWLLTYGTRLLAWNVGSFNPDADTDADPEKNPTALQGGTRPPYFVTFSNDGQRLITSQASWAVEIGPAIFTLSDMVPFEAPVVSTSMDNRLVTTSDLWVRTNEGKPRELARIDARLVKALPPVFDPTGKWLISAGDRVLRWDLAGGAEFARLEHDAEVVTFAADPSNRYFATTTADGFVHLWTMGDSPDGWSKVRALEIGKREGAWSASNALFSSDGRSLAASSEKVLKVFATDDWREVVRREQESNVNSMGFTPDGRWLVTVGTDQDFDRVEVIDMNTGRVTSLPKAAQASMAHAVSISPDASWLAIKTNPQCWRSRAQQHFSPGVVRIFQIGTGEQIASLPLGLEALPGGCGETPSSGGTPESPSGRVELAKEALNWRPAWVMPNPGKTAESPDGNWQVEWAERSGEISFKYQGGRPVSLPHPAKINDVGFVSNGRWLVSTGGDGNARVWALNRVDMKATACERLNENLSAPEWRKYLADEPFTPICANLDTR